MTVDRSPGQGMLPTGEVGPPPPPPQPYDVIETISKAVKALSRNPEIIRSLRVG